MATKKLILGERAGINLNRHLSRYIICTGRKLLNDNQIYVYHYKNCTIIISEIERNERDQYLTVQCENERVQKEIFGELEKIALSKKRVKSVGIGEPDRENIIGFY